MFNEVYNNYVSPRKSLHGAELALDREGYFNAVHTLTVYDNISGGLEVHVESGGSCLVIACNKQRAEQLAEFFTTIAGAL